MKKLAFLGGAAGLGLIALLSSPHTQAADHLDSTALASNPMADINDVYAWMTADGNNVNLAMTVSPIDNGMRNFGPSVVYAFHVTRHATLPLTAQALAMGEESKVICKFASNTSGECWVVDPMNQTLDYVKGDFSGTTGRLSLGGKLRVFAGRRSDPFFFNLAGFFTAQKQAATACGGGTAGDCPGVLPTDNAGCPLLDTATANGLANSLKTEQNCTTTPNPLSTCGPCPANQADCFLNLNVMAIVVQLDKTLVTSDAKKLLSVWGSTHVGS